MNYAIILQLRYFSDNPNHKKIYGLIVLLNNGGKHMTKFHALDFDFYEKPTLDLAQSLLGCLLIKETPEGICSGYIVETEAYMGPCDRAAHSFGNRRTKRTEIIWPVRTGLYISNAYSYIGKCR